MLVSVFESKSVIRRDLYLVIVFCYVGLLVGLRRWRVCEVKDAEYSFWGFGVNFFFYSRRFELYVFMVGIIWVSGVCFWFLVLVGLFWGIIFFDRLCCK